jgi:hypothetical protein
MHLESPSSDFNTSSSSFVADLTGHRSFTLDHIFLLKVYKNFILKQSQRGKYFYFSISAAHSRKWLLIVVVYVDFTVLTNRVVVI